MYLLKVFTVRVYIYCVLNDIKICVLDVVDRT